MNIIWPDDSDCAYGACDEMSKTEFLEAVKKDLREMDPNGTVFHYQDPDTLKLEDVEKVLTIHAKRDIPAYQLMPLAGLGVTIEEYWTLKMAYRD